jgi:hypothetical protein
VSSTTRTPKHVEVAAAEGMKAGFRQFSAAASKAGLGPVKALWSEFEALSAKPRFNLYCSMFGPSVDAITAKPSVRNYTRSSGRVKNASAAPIQEDNKLSNVQRIAELEAEIARLSQVAAVVEETPVRVIAPADPKAPVTYKQAMTLRFKMGLTKKAVEKLNQGQASKKIAAFYATA